MPASLRRLKESEMGFFDEPQGAAVFKHAILKCYLPTFASKVGRFSSGHRVAYLDGYAGPGAYEDGTPGSPALALDTAKYLAEIRDVHCYLVEEDLAQVEKLAAVVAASGLAEHAHVRRGDVSTHLVELLAEIGEAPLFAFLDPFGLGIGFNELSRTLLGRSTDNGGRRHGPATEVLVTFVRAGVYRNAGKLDLDSDDSVQISSAQTIVKLVDHNLGGWWWRDMWQGPGGVVEKVVAIRDEYVRRVLNRAGESWRCYSVAVSDSWRGSPIYDLLFFTQHPQGPWFFNEAVSLARQVFRDHFGPDDAAAAQLWDPEDEWRDHIAANLTKLLGAGHPVNLLQAYELVYGDALGYARQAHVRTAIKRLHKEGITSSNGVGKVHEMVLIPNAPRARNPSSGTSVTA